MKNYTRVAIKPMVHLLTLKVLQKKNIEIQAVVSFKPVWLIE